MAGSAVNLGGMLSQIGQSLGSTGRQTGQNLVAPLLEIQKEQRAQEEAERLKAMEMASIKGMMGDITAANNAAVEAQQNPNAMGDSIAAQRQRLQEAAQQNPSQAAQYLAKDKELAAMQVELNTRGSLKQYNDITGWLKQNAQNPAVPPQVVDAYIRQQQKLSEVPGVRSAIAAQNKAAADAKLQQLDMIGKEQRVEDAKASKAGAAFAQAMLQGITKEQLQAKYPSASPKAWQYADKHFASVAEAQRTAAKWRESNTEVNSSDIPAGPLREGYEKAVKMRGVPYANKWLGDRYEQQTKKDLTTRLEGEQALLGMSSQEAVYTLLNQDSETTGFFGFRSKDVQELYGEQDAEGKQELLEVGAEAYAKSMNAGKGLEQATFEAEQAMRMYGGLGLAKRPEKFSESMTIEEILSELAQLEGSTNGSGS